MKYSLMVRSRPDATESVTEKHQRFAAGFTAVARALGVAPAELPPVQEPKVEKVEVSLWAALKRRARARVSYQNRKSMRDESTFDDYCVFDFDPRKSSSSEMLTAFEACIVAFGGYYGHVKDEEFLFADAGRIGIVDVRLRIPRVFPIGFFDETLLQRALGLRPREVVDRLSSRAGVSVKELAGGVLIASEPWSGSFEKMKALSDELSGLLGLNTR